MPSWVTRSSLYPRMMAQIAILPAAGNSAKIVFIASNVWDDSLALAWNPVQLRSAPSSSALMPTAAF